MANNAVGFVVKSNPAIDGAATISGTVKVVSTLSSRPVVLLTNDLRPVAQTRSAANGVYSFPNVAAGRKWVVIGIDDQGAYNATIADRVQT